MKPELEHEEMNKRLDASIFLQYLLNVPLYKGDLSFQFSS